MSLTSFVNRPDIRARLCEEFPKPRIETDRKLLAPPRSKRHSLVGTAFDYLLRFYLQRLNPRARERPWVAERGFEKLAIQTTGEMIYDIDAEELSFPDDNGAVTTGRRILHRARAAQQRYIASGSITDSLLESVIGLAQLDTVYRAGFVDENLGVAHREDMRDLRKLISLVNPSEFRAREMCLLNPNFGAGSRLIGGADADLFIDGTLIDVKVTKNMELTRDHFNQLLTPTRDSRCSAIPTKSRVHLDRHRGEAAPIPSC